MADGGKQAVTAQLFAGVIAASARAGESAATMQQRVSAEAERLGVGTSFAIRTDAARLFGAWTGVRVASERLSRAPLSDAITHEVIAQLPYGAGLTSIAGPRVFHVRVPYTAVRFGQTEDSYITLRYTGDLPPTVGDLKAEAADILGALVPSYSAELVEIGDIEIGEL